MIDSLGCLNDAALGLSGVTRTVPMEQQICEEGPDWSRSTQGQLEMNNVADTSEGRNYFNPKTNKLLDCCACLQQNKHHFRSTPLHKPHTWYIANYETEKNTNRCVKLWRGITGRGAGRLPLYIYSVQVPINDSKGLR